MTIRAVIFDFGGVFSTSPVENFEKFERENDLPKRFIGSIIKENHHTNAWAKFERAEISLDEFNDAFANESRAAGFEITGRQLVGLLSVRLHAPMATALRRVKDAGFKTGCITNNMPQIDGVAILADGESKQTVTDIFSLFDHVIESAKAGVRKPEPRVYEMMYEALQVAPTDCIFLDDLGINLKPARDLGMTTIKVPVGDITPAIKELAGYIDLELI